MSVISVIVTTYNWEHALTACIQSLFVQQDLNFEIIIADDGSKLPTTQCVHQLQQQSPVRLTHCFHPDRGFRAGTIRNKAVLLSMGNYLIFIDGDCVVLPHFIKRHRLLAQRNYFIPGNRILLSKKFTHTVLKDEIQLPKKNIITFIIWRLRGRINRLLPLVYLPFDTLRFRHPQRWEKAMTCNLALWKNDFIAINGFDALFEGWGYEDSDLVIRLIHLGVQRKEGRFAVPVLHLWHPLQNRATESSNYQRLIRRVNDVRCTQAEQGLNHLTKLLSPQNHALSEHF